MSYTITNAPITNSFREMSKKELQNYYTWYMNNILIRIQILEQAVQESLPNWKADYSPESLLTLGEWFASQAEERPMTLAEIQEEEKKQENLKFKIPLSNTNILTNRTISIAMDIGMYMSQAFLKNVPDLQWEQNLTRKRDVDYGQPVLGKKDCLTFNPTFVMISVARKFAKKYMEPDTKRLLVIYHHGIDKHFDIMPPKRGQK